MSSLATDPETAHPTDTDQTLTIVCTDCGTTVFEWSTPHPDRCWECAETADLEVVP